MRLEGRLQVRPGQVLEPVAVGHIPKGGPEDVVPKALSQHMEHHGPFFVSDNPGDGIDALHEPGEWNVPGWRDEAWRSSAAIDGDAHDRRRSVL
jgi:hypothetical protein